MRRLPLIVLLTMVIGPSMAMAQQQHIYKWTDGQGIAHFSDSPPPRGTKYEELQTGADPAAAGSSAAPAQVVSSESAATATKSERIEDNAANRKKLCDQLSKNMTLLQGDAPLTVDSAESDQQTMSEDRRDEELANAQQQYDQYCK